MKKLLKLLTVLLLSTILVASGAVAAASTPLEHQTAQANWPYYFKEAGVQGAFVLYDLNNDHYIYYNRAQCEQGFIPASTFKIMNSLIALETGVVQDQNHALSWDKVMRDGPAQWNQDQTLKTAFQNSVVWYYQALAREIGQKRMQQYLDKAAYGNQNSSGGLEHFWLTGALRITPKQQVQLLKKLYANQLPFSQRSMDIVKEIMLREQTEQLILRGKTGWSTLDNQEVGWYVGYIEKAGNVYFFALNITSPVGNAQFVAARVAIANKILSDLHIL